MGLLFFSKKGTTSVFLTMILASMIFTIGVFIYQSSLLAGKSYADAVLELAGRSLLSEYDTRLQKQYGIFALHTDQSLAEKKIKYYTDYSFHENYFKEITRWRQYMDPLHLKLKSVEVNLKGYSIINTDIFEEQILDNKLYDFAGRITDNKKTVNQTQPDIELKNKQVINSLPSLGYSKTSIDINRILAGGIPSPQEIMNSGSDTFFVNEYIMGRFFNRLSGAKTRSTFFSNEVEYILTGDFNDKGNYSNVRRDIFLLRTGLNLAHIYSDSAKRSQVAIMAEALTPGPAALLTQAVINGLWSAAEAENDLRRLEDRKAVPLIKSKEQWTLSLGSVLQGNTKAKIKRLCKDAKESEGRDYLELGKSMQPAKARPGYVEPIDTSGIEYKGYLRIFLYLENREIKLLRCMDLIQLNLKGTYYKDFDLKEYYGGFQFDAVVSDRTYTYIQMY